MSDHEREPVSQPGIETVPLSSDHVVIHLCNDYRASCEYSK